MEKFALEKQEYWDNWDGWGQPWNDPSVNKADKALNK